MTRQTLHVYKCKKKLGIPLFYLMFILMIHLRCKNFTIINIYCIIWSNNNSWKFWRKIFLQFLLFGKEIRCLNINDDSVIVSNVWKTDDRRNRTVKPSLSKRSYTVRSKYFAYFLRVMFWIFTIISISQAQNVGYEWQEDTVDCWYNCYTVSFWDFFKQEAGLCEVIFGLRENIWIKRISELLWYRCILL